MYRIIEKFHLERYLSSKLILCIDLIVSMSASLFALLLSQALIHPIEHSLFSYSSLWVACSLIFSLISFKLFKTHYSIIRHSTLREISRLGMAVILKEVLMAVTFICFIYFGICELHTKKLIVIIDLLFSFFALVFIRSIMVIIYDLIRVKNKEYKKRKRILVYGIDNKSVSLVKRLGNSPHYAIVGFITYGDKQYHTINNMPVYYFQNIEGLEFLKNQYDIEAILFASEDQARKEQDRLINFSIKCDVRVMVSPKIDEVIDGKIRQGIRDIKIEDLLGRSEIKISMNEITANFKDKVILVTGAAGSIGSELCRQLATFGIKHLVLFDNGETPMHNLRLELEEKYPDLKFTPIIGDVRLPLRLDYAFRRFHPQVVFHAAAYKHVPLMEENPCEAVLVNVAGSRNVADKCIEYGVEKMVMISTDKAVNPTNIMGCTKRLAEIYVQSLGIAIAKGLVQGKTKFVTTRFGNVLGSNGSVIPRFREQIEKGGPVTVTHPDITRFFMTIPEACRLVMEAATMSTGNQIFVFDMGKSVKIATLAKRMIELAGLREGIDINIEYTGLRPGEKLYEEVLSNTENTLPTNHNRIRVAKVREYDYNDAQKAAKELEELSRNVNIPDMVRLMKHIVPEYKSNNSEFQQYDKEIEAENKTEIKA